MSLQALRKTIGFKCALSFQVLAFIFSGTFLPARVHAQSVMELPAPGMMVSASDAYVPVMLRAVKVHPDNPLVFDFIVDSGNTKADQEMIKAQTQKLVKYFLATLTVPEKDLWVNLSPYEHDRIASEAFGETQMGRDLLAQDYILKQLSASLIYPERELGREFWSRVYAKTHEVLGTSEIPMNTFNKVWIMPDKAEVYEMNDTAVIGKSHLKVLMEEDYLALQKNLNDKSAETEQFIQGDMNESSKVSMQVMRELVLPEIEKEVNVGKNFALLRQVYQSLILATWYKNNLKESLLAQVYADQNKVAGVDVVDRTEKEQIYQRYVAAYKEGVFNYIKEEKGTGTSDATTRKYFAGGANFNDMSQKLSVKKVDNATQINVDGPVGDISKATVAAVRQVDTNEDDSLRTAFTVTDDDFQELLKARADGKSGFHLNVDTSRKFTPATEDAVLNWATMPEAEKMRLSKKQDEMFRQGKIGKIEMVGGEATRFGGPKTFVEITKELGEFLQVKVSNLKWAWQKYGVRTPLFLLSSDKRIGEFRDKLRARD